MFFCFRAAFFDLSKSCLANIWLLYRAVYEELGKYGDIENQVLCRERVEELEPSVRYCLHKVGESSLQTSELLDIGKMEGPALDLFKAKLEVSFVSLKQKLSVFFFLHLKAFVINDI